MGLRGLKILVISLGVVLAGGFVVLVVGLGQRIAGLYGPETPEAPYRLALPLAGEEAIVSLTAVGDDLAVLVEAADGSRRILVVDPAGGRLLGTLEGDGVLP